MEPLILQKKLEVFVDFVYPILKNFPRAEKFALCQEIKQSCYRALKNIMLANNTKHNRKFYLQQSDAEFKLLLVLFKIAQGQKYITNKKLFEIQNKIAELGRIIGGLLKTAN